MTRRRWVLAGYAGWMLLLIILYYAWAAARVPVWGLIGLSGVLAIVAGVVLNRPSHKAPWLLLAAANLSFAVGQMIFLVVTDVTGGQLSFPSVADGFYLATYPLYAAGLLTFIRCRTAGRDRRSLLDALTLTVGLALLVWIFLILPDAAAPGLSAVQQAVSIAYPLGDVLVLAMLARLLVPGGLRSRSVQLLTLGTVGLVASDISFGLIQLNGTFRNGTIVDLGWAAFYAAWGAAALHPAMARLTSPVSRRDAETSTTRLILLMLAALAAPVVLFVEAVMHSPSDAGVIAVFSAVLYLLVFWRLAEVAGSHRRALERERVLRVAGSSLASAVTVEGVAGAVSQAVAELHGEQRRRALLAVREEGTLRIVGALPDEAAAVLAAPGTVPAEWLTAVAAPGLHLIRRAGPAGETSEQGGTHEAMQYARGGTSQVLLTALMLTDRPSGEPLIGLLAVFGEERTLATLSPTIETLAGQAALAVERVLLSQELNRRNSEAYFRTLVHDASDIILIVNDDGVIRYATPSVEGIFGGMSVEGAYLWDLIQQPERDHVLHGFARLRDQDARGTEDWRIARPDGTFVEVEVRVSDLRHDRTVGGLVLTLRDVTGQRELERELKYRALHDALTGLPNRALFHDRTAQALAVARRGGSTVSVLFIDLDDFKLVNDTLGHTVGDELLVAAGRRLSVLAQDSSMVSRLGGDEFALLVEHPAGGARAEELAAQIVGAFAEPFSLPAGSAIATATVGVATSEDSTDTGELVRHADLALYAAKAAGKRQWLRYRPVLSAGMFRRRELQAAIGDAVASNAFTLVYQPIVALRAGEVVGFEALVRWPHPQWGMIQPDQFITLAEETGHIIPLGSWVLQRALTDAVTWLRRAREAPPYVSVNVSARQFRDPGFVDTVRRSLARSGLPPSSLLLELTESVLLRRDDRVRPALAELKQLGIRLAIDDFGTGYSSLSYLRELPIDVIKIDKSFVEGIAVDERRLALVEVIVRIAKTLGLTVMAEGIEDEVQQDLLLSMGCQYGQGYLLARPVSGNEAELMARNGLSMVPHARADVGRA